MGFVARRKSFTDGHNCYRIPKDSKTMKDGTTDKTNARAETAPPPVTRMDS